MKVHVLLIATALLAAANGQDFTEKFKDAANSLEQQMASMQRILGAVTNQLMMQQYFLEERTRASGKSGVKKVRLRYVGTKSYHIDSHTSFGSLSIHDHGDNIRTIGMGEFSAVLNGIEFTTRHNDYRLNMPHRTNMSYGMVEPIPFPEVPPSVAAEKNLTKAIQELQEYFRAWRDQNKTHRDYTNYFKPVLCYLEGAWTNAGASIDEPFFSDRHFIDAKSWTELQQKSRFVAYSGTKSLLENLAFLPTNVLNVINDTIPVFAQFNYRILCHPIKQEVPLNRFRVVDDLHLRVNTKRSIFEHERSRGARFQLSPTNGPFQDALYLRGFLDELMEEIPGPNNYPGYFEDDGLDSPALEWDGVTKKDVSRYHRIFKIGGKDATGISSVNRGFNDDFMFAAMTNHSKVVGMTINKTCTWVKDPITNKNVKYCPTLSQKWTWAFPLEIIYLTPLQSWNPYDLEYKGDSGTPYGDSIFAVGRDGTCQPRKAFNGTNSKNYYQTPSEFFGLNFGSSTADTVRGTVCVEDSNGVPRKVQASGSRIFLPTIGDLGAIRTRYPIYPVHEEGTTAWKEVEALKELVMDPKAYGKYFWKPSNEDESDNFSFRLGYSTTTKVSRHTHTFSLTKSQMTSLKFGAAQTVQTSTDEGHQHTLELQYISNTNELRIAKCDSGSNCWDGHPRTNLTSVGPSEV